MMRSVRNPKALSAFPEFADVLRFETAVKKQILPLTFMRPAEIRNRVEQVVSRDAR